MGNAEEIRLVLELMRMKPSLTAKEAAEEIKAIRDVLYPARTFTTTKQDS